MASTQLRQLLKRARDKAILELVEAVEAELQLRGEHEFDEQAAVQHTLWAESAANLDLARTIELAFSLMPPNEDERGLIRAIFARPGISFPALVEVRGKRDVSLYFGHMIKSRFGYFRRFVDTQKKMSDLLFHREPGQQHMTYRLTPEAEQAFQALDLI
jgi:hypothetical protein